MKSQNILVAFNLPTRYVKKILKVSSEITIERSWSESKLIEASKNVDIIFAGILNNEMVKAAKQLKWVHSASAGVNDMLAIPDLVKRPILLTNSSGVAAIPIAEHVLAMMLVFCRRLNELMALQREGVWREDSWVKDPRFTLSFDELYEKTIGVVGLGRIGSEVAKRAKCFGMNVIAIKKKMEPKKPFVDELLPSDKLTSLLKKSDFVVLSVPLTPETNGMIGINELKAMKKTAYIINIGRGKIIKEEELIRALKEKMIAGAGLDVFEEEPLHSNSELWKMKNVVITPHAAGNTIRYWDRTTEIFCENLKRFINNQPMINVIDKKAAY